MTDNSLKVCFVALGAYSLLMGKISNVIIGPDVHQAIMIKELKKYDLDVSVITYGENCVSTEHVNSIEFIKIHADTCRLRAAYIVSKMFRMWAGMRKSKADIYLHAGGAAGVTSIFCKLTDRKYIYSIASDALADKTLISQNVGGFSQSKFSISNIGNWLDIKLADAIVVQNEYQKMMLKRNFGRDGTLIKMPFPLTKGGNPKKANPPIVLWVGSMAEVKQPELFVKLAEAIPETRFQMIGGHSGNQELYDRMKYAAGKVSNLEFLGVVPFNEIDEYFDRASILVNTSMFEGFPNAFVQAWMHYVPVVSLNADPDELLCENKSGLHSKTFDQMVKDIKILLNNKPLSEEMGMNGRNYVEANHNVANIVGQYIDVFKRIMHD